MPHRSRPRRPAGSPTRVTARRLGALACASLALAGLPASAGVVATAPALVGGPAELASFGGFDIRYSFSIEPDAVTRAAFDEAESFWESVIAGYATPELAALAGPLEIDVDLGRIDGVGGILGGASVEASVAEGGLAADGSLDITSPVVPDRSRFILDADDLGTDLLEGIVTHETGHALGLEPVTWLLNNLLFLDDLDGDGTAETPLFYIGQNGTEAYARERGFAAGAAAVALELDGGPGTRFAHFNEDSSGSLADGIDTGAFAGVPNGLGGFIDNAEIMSGFIGLNDVLVLSQTTRFATQDVGYALGPVAGPAAADAQGIRIVTGAAVPLPGAGWLLLGGLAGLAAARRGRAQSGVDRTPART